MAQSARFILFGFLTIATSGCVVVGPSNGLSLKSLSKPKVTNVSFEEEVPETPAEPENPTQLRLTYAKLMEQVGHVTEAREHYSNVTDEQPENVDAILGLARVELASGNYGAAESGFKKALRLHPESASAHFGLGQFYASRNQWQDSVEPFTKAMLAEPENTTYRYHLAVALTHSGDVDSALPHFIRTVGDAEAHYNVGLILKNEGNLGQAERHFLLAVTKKPSLEPAQTWLNYLRKQRQGIAAELPESAPMTSHVSAHSLSNPS